VLVSGGALLLVAASFLAPALPAGADGSVTLYVNVTASGTADCSSSANACASIQSAINAAELETTSEVTIDVAAGTYDENDAVDVPVGDTLTIQGTGAVTVGGGSSASVFTISAGAVTIDNVTISDGVTSGSGGGVDITGGTVTLSDDTLTDDSAATSGGGVFNATSATATLTNDTLSSDSTTGTGGGVDNQGSATLINDTLSDDMATTSGGGIESESGATTSVANSILDTASCDGSGTVVDGGYNVESDDTCGFGTDDVVNSTTIDLAASLAANGSSGPETLAIGRDSSAYEEVPAANCTTMTDERGDARPGVVGANCDAGAFEDQIATASLSLSGTPVFGNNTYDVSLTVPATAPAPSEEVVVTDSSSLSCNASLTLSTATLYTGSCTIDGEAAGATVTATYDADGADPNYFEATSTNTLTVEPMSQTINFASSVPSSPTVGGTYVVSATGGASEEPVTFSIDAASTPDACSISGSTVSLIGVGTCVIDANQAGDTDYAAALQAQQSFSILPANQHITFTSSVPSSPTVGGAYVVSATGGASGNTVVFSIDATSTAGACTISGSTVSLTGVGGCVIDANQAGNANYVAAPQTQQSFAIHAASGSGPTSPGSQVITFTSSVPSSPTVGGTYVVSATGGASGNPVVFSIDATSTAGACTITDSTVSLAGVGTCVVDANQAGNTNYSSATEAQQTFSIVLGEQVITFTSSVPSSPTVGGTYVVSATGGASGNPVTFTIDAASTKGACTIAGSTVSLTGAGTCVIDANQAANASYAAAPGVHQSFVVKSGTSTVPPTKPVPKIVIHLDTFTNSGGTVHESVKLSCVRAACSGVVRSLGQITTTTKVSVKTGPWTITKKVTKILKVVLTRAPYHLAKGASAVLTLTVSASGRSALAKANSTTPFYETLTATVNGGLMVTRSTSLRRL
jgi:hypothetical protein